MKQPREHRRRSTGPGEFRPSTIERGRSEPGSERGVARNAAHCIGEGFDVIEGQHQRIDVLPQDLTEDR